MTAHRPLKTARALPRMVAASILGAMLINGPAPTALAQGTIGNANAPGAADAPEGPGRRAAIRFVTDTDYPPFNYHDEDGTLTGLNIDLAKALCLELAATCDIQVRPWAGMISAVRNNETDAVIASHVATPALMRDVAISDRYYFTPARFVGLKETVIADVTPGGLARRKIAVARGSAHEAYLRAFFRLSDIQVHDNADLARDAVRNKSADLLFDDGIGLVFWLNGEASKLCCDFKGGAFTEQHYFGDGVGILLRRDDGTLRVQINGALKRLRETGRIEELMLRYFPIRPY